jgi:hypothetical protein
VRGEKPLESGSPLFSGLHNFHVIFSEVQISGSDAHSEEGNRRRKDDDEIRHVNNFPFSLPSSSSSCSSWTEQQYR